MSEGHVHVPSVWHSRPPVHEVAVHPDVDSHTPPWQVPVLQAAPFFLFGWVQVPLPSQILRVHSLPSSGQAVPKAAFVVTHRFVPKSQLACLQDLVGFLQVGKALEQLHLPLPRHLPVLHWLPVVQLLPPLSSAAAASRTDRALSTPPRLSPPRRRARPRRERGVVSVRARASKRSASKRGILSDRKRRWRPDAKTAQSRQRRL